MSTGDPSSGTPPPPNAKYCPACFGQIPLPATRCMHCGMDFFPKVKRDGAKEIRDLILFLMIAGVIGAVWLASQR